MTEPITRTDAEILDELSKATETIRQKLIDALTPGFQAEFDPDEAERLGAFEEDALSEQDAIDSDTDLLDAPASVDRQET